LTTVDDDYGDQLAMTALNPMLMMALTDKRLALYHNNGNA
jgi:hypothetical protein